MLSVTVIAVGKIKEKFFTAAIDEYSKRLSAYCRFEIVEVKDEKTPENPSANEKNAVLECEVERIIQKIPKGAKVVTLCVEGKQMSSEDFADLISRYSVEGTSKLVFIIGGSMGLSERIKKISDLRLSFSEMTFPHMLMRVILAEQLYRGFTIISGKTYHK
ncbi:MAG: 23S rRNA (pseudouridine(1915)-N(3))-methyltransferase RlmH [Ruminococcaceae bacterium]|nr:23S rRNA (pseudouridine(1915)-N(3))-methyltransferase RlmH [Oscillospiraceae bacterium]